MGYDPELDTSPESDPDVVSYYLNIISILRWMIKLGRINIIMEVSLFPSHLDAAVHAIAHVGQRYNSRLVYDNSYPEIACNVFKKCDCSEFIGMSRRLYP